MRHICGISGGKDSSALAIHMRDRVPEMEYFFCDTGAELPETYTYLAKLEVVLGKSITRLNSDRDFAHYFELFRGTLPSPQMRWCTTLLKIKPLEEWIGEDEAVSYVAIRADESNRKGYVSTKPNITTRFPFIEDGIDHAGVVRILEDAGINLPEYYKWRTRSGCYFCFFQRKAEWVGLADNHPDLFEKAVAIEQKTLKDAGLDGDASFADSGMKGRQYTWSDGETLTELLSRRDDIAKRHDESMRRAKKRRKNLPLIEVLSDALDDDDETTPCTVCHL
ncbi:MAG: phosphoadenosine phosphosulfate reductase family protein [Cenarchaeum sp. SB0665_bin_23]|nr:phosphoadenosine phosphosulfate reductase family protein [Cenarchaeum sp. SB0667_bin_13]MXY61491.1 phosphoadenosine phosphosulfate reductase family protein [Cenarchaeum sp. SB0665_bin_23]MXZ93964.1 phosphoadenosine phosphosulfate reductase family protein [Cenarchaeum sp. SB0666_bin_15]MYB46184.1 phosphoadenosine phosphosulfate reductase family protein [Cenarchaeum sp. SB0662_bin_33]MYC80059.1 phosphoadenosine phosphosulfate reductase family protein [Cenarchaeum sp. SB0661_bin_35]MYD58715.1 